MFVGPAVVLAALALRGERKRAEYVASRMADLAEAPKQPLAPVSLIVLVTRESEGLAEALGSFAAQDHPDFELIVVVRNTDSIAPGALPAVVKVVIASETGRPALLGAGIRAAARRSSEFAFASPDGLVSTFWLRALVAPLDELGVGA